MIELEVYVEMSTVEMINLGRQTTLMGLVVAMVWCGGNDEGHTGAYDLAHDIQSSSFQSKVMNNKTER